MLAQGPQGPTESVTAELPLLVAMDAPVLGGPIQSQR